MDEMSMKERTIPILLFLMLVSFAPNFALAGTLPNDQPAPDQVSSCPGAKVIPATERTVLFVFNSRTGTSGYECDFSSGSNNYKLYYDSNWAYLGGLDLTAKKYFNPAGKYNDNTVNPGETSKLSDAANGKCALNNWDFNDCFWFPLMESLGSWFLTIGGGLLRLAGALFDLLIWHVIIGFGSTLNGGMKTAIDGGWTLFRDIANIAIIGMFVFIAIGIILGLKPYGNKKLVANVIIVAVLLNFSLLFTRMMIDFSNFTAFQFYSAAAKSDGKDVSQDPKNFDIATAFLKPMGITNVWQTSELTKKVAAQSDSGWAAFLYGLAGGVMLGFIAFVLAYGSYLIALRGILFIVLMITAALAFASYLVPKFAEGAYGFATWWKALLNACIFAPLLMIFLFISLQLARVGARTTVEINNFLSDPSSAATA